MNVNPKIMRLQNAMGYPVSPDIYKGQEDRYIVFTYEDERAVLRGDNTELLEEAYLQVSLFLPEDENYFSDKKKMKQELIKQGFVVTSVQSWLEDEMMDAQRKRRITFSVHITEADE